jgi:DNA-binding NarL/FixJ family response regulator
MTIDTPLLSVRILLVDDSTLFRNAIRELLQTQPGWTVCDEADNGLAAVEKATAQHPDVVIMDLEMPKMNGLEAAERLAELAPSIPVLMISNYDVKYLVDRKKLTNVRGYLLKTELGCAILKAVQSVLGDSSSEAAARA